MKLPKPAHLLASMQHQQRTLQISTKLPRRAIQPVSKTVADPSKLTGDQETAGVPESLFPKKTATIRLGSWASDAVSRVLSHLFVKPSDDISLGERKEDAMAARKINACEQIIGYTFKDRELAWEALQDPSSGVSVVGSRRLPKGNRRLALLGDKVLAMILVKTWYFAGPSGYEWNQQQHFQSNKSLTDVAVQIGLVPCLNWGHTCPPTTDVRTWGTLVEAVVAAVYIDGGYDEAEKLLGRLGFLELDGPPAARALVSPADDAAGSAETHITAKTSIVHQVLRRIDADLTTRTF